MANTSPDPSIVASFARRYTLLEIEEAVGQLQEAILTGVYASLSILGVSTSINAAQAETNLKTLEAARSKKLADADATGEAEAIRLDALKPLGTGLDFSLRRIE